MSEAVEQTGAAEVPSFNRILLVTDFSACSIAAVPFARLLANYYHAPVTVVHVLSGDVEDADETRETSEAHVREFVAENQLTDVVSEVVVAQGPVWEAIAALVEERHIDLVVLGTHGRSGVGKLLLGSVAQRIFSLAPCPVLTVSPKSRKTWGPDDQLTRILYATDFSQNSLNALPYALSLARVSHAELLLLHAPESAEAMSADVVQGYHQHLNELIPAEHRNWCKSDTFVTAGDPGHVILDAASKYSVDFIVIGSHAIEGKLSPFQVPLTTAYRIVAQAPCPVLRVRS